jgi:hypothetical protein
MALRSSEEVRAAARRRQREYRERQKSHKSHLESKAFKANVLEDAIKLCATRGHPIAASIIKHVPNPDLEQLTYYFQAAAEELAPNRSASRNTKTRAAPKGRAAARV